jgi:DNA-binding NtrC family response regulator
VADERAEPARQRSLQQRSHLLLVDDDQALLNALSGTLEARFGHFSLDTSDSGAKALELAKRKHYDTIILDVNMPNVDGFEVLAVVKKLQPQTPVLLISGHADATMMEKAIEKGATELIAKPFDRENFVLSVRRSLALSDAQSAARRGLQQHASPSVKRQDN